MRRRLKKFFLLPTTTKTSYNECQAENSNTCDLLKYDNEENSALKYNSMTTK